MSAPFDDDSAPRRHYNAFQINLGYDEGLFTIRADSAAELFGFIEDVTGDFALANGVRDQVIKGFVALSEGKGTRKPLASASSGQQAAAKPAAELHPDKVCPGHQLPYKHMVGTSKASGKPYDFWACSAQVDRNQQCRPL